MVDNSQNERTKNPVFIVSSERSGSNLLRKLIGEYSDIDNPKPIHLLKWLYFREPLYGDLNLRSNLDKLVQDGLNLAYIHFSPWTVKISKESLAEQLNRTEKSVLGLFDAMYSAHASDRGKTGYLCKDNHLFDYIYPLLNYFSEPKFIYLYRDPRDYALSQYKRTLMTKDLVSISKLWRKEQLRCFQLMLDERLKENTYFIKYEDIITDEKKCVTEILNFLGERVIEEASNEKKTEEQDEEYLPEAWKNLNKGVLKNNKNKFLEGFTEFEIDMVEGICWNEMKFLGYKPVNEKRPKLPAKKVMFKRAVQRTQDLLVNPKAKLSDTEYKLREKRKKFLNSLK